MILKIKKVKSVLVDSIFVFCVYLYAWFTGVKCVSLFNICCCLRYANINGDANKKRRNSKRNEMEIKPNAHFDLNLKPTKKKQLKTFFFKHKKKTYSLQSNNVNFMHWLLCFVINFFL